MLADMESLPQEARQILSSCANDTQFFGSFFFPGDFYSPFNALNKAIFKALDSAKPGDKKLIAAPRGSGKTTIVKTYAAKRLLFRQSSFIVYISNTSDLAIQQTESLKLSITTEDSIRTLFGEIPAKKVTMGEGDTFSKKSWLTSTGCYVVPRGCGQQVRGMNTKVPKFNAEKKKYEYISVRPNLIIFDDLENRERMRSDTYRVNTRKWFYADALEIVPKYIKDYIIIYIDTLKHEDSLMRKMIDSGEWDVTFLEACDDEFNPTAPTYMTKEELIQKYELLKSVGEGDTFYSEYRNKALDPTDKVFPRRYRKYFVEEAGRLVPLIGRETDLVNFQSGIKSSSLSNVVILDPAKEVKAQNADSAIVGIGYNTSTGQIFIRDIIHGKLMPDEVVNNLISMAIMLKAEVIAVEVTSLHQWLMQPIKQEITRRGAPVQVVELTAVGHKEDRIAALAPLYKLGYIWCKREISHIVDGQLDAFPSGRLVDVIDAISYILPLSEGAGLFGDSVDPIPPNYEPETEQPFYSYLDGFNPFVSEFGGLN